MALALAPGSADAPTAVLLLGKARQGVAATLGEGGRGVTKCQTPLPSVLRPSSPAFELSVSCTPDETPREGGATNLLTGCLGSVSWKQRPRGFWVGGREC